MEQKILSAVTYWGKVFHNHAYCMPASGVLTVQILALGRHRPVVENVVQVLEGGSRLRSCIPTFEHDVVQLLWTHDVSTASGLRVRHTEALLDFFQNHAVVHTCGKKSARIRDWLSTIMTGRQPSKANAWSFEDTPRRLLVDINKAISDSLTSHASSKWNEA